MAASAWSDDVRKNKRGQESRRTFYLAIRLAKHYFQCRGEIQIVTRRPNYESNTCTNSNNRKLIARNNPRRIEYQNFPFDRSKFPFFIFLIAQLLKQIHNRLEYSLSNFDYRIFVVTEDRHHRSSIIQLFEEVLSGNRVARLRLISRTGRTRSGIWMVRSARNSAARVSEIDTDRALLELSRE